MSEPKWTPDKIRQEIYDARTKTFVVTKVLETGNIDLSENPEWVLVIRPLIRDIKQYLEQIEEHLGTEEA